MRKTGLKMRIISMLLCFLMVFTSIPTDAFAATQEAYETEDFNDADSTGNDSVETDEGQKEDQEEDQDTSDQPEETEDDQSEEEASNEDSQSQNYNVMAADLGMSRSAEQPKLVITSNVEWASSNSSTELPYLYSIWFDEEPEDWDDEESYAGVIDSDYVIKPSTNETLEIENYSLIQETCPLDYVEIAGLKLYFSDFAKFSTWQNVTFDASEYPGLFGKGISIQYTGKKLGIDLLAGYEDVTADIPVNFVFTADEDEPKLSVNEGTNYILYAANYLRTQDDGSALYGVYVRPKNGYQLSSYTIDGTEVPISLTEESYVRYTVDGDLKQCNYFEIAISEDKEIALNCVEATVNLNLHAYNPVNAGDYISKYLWYISAMGNSIEKQFAKHTSSIPLFADSGAKFWFVIETNGFLPNGNDATNKSVKIYSGTDQIEGNLIFDSTDPDAFFSYDHADRVEESVMLLSDITEEDSALALSGREKTGGYVVLSKCPDLEKITLVVDYKGYHLVKTVDIQMANAIDEVKEYTKYYTENYGLDKLGIEAYTEAEKQTEGYETYCKYSNFRYVMRIVYQEYLEKIAGAKEEERVALLAAAKTALDEAARGEGCNAVVWSFLNKDGVTAIPAMVAIPNESNISASDAMCAALEALYPGNWSYNFTLTQFGAFVNSVSAGGAEDTGCIHAKQSASTGINYGLWFYNGKFSDWGVSNYYPADGDVMFWGGGDVEKNWAWAWLRLKYGDQKIKDILAEKGENRDASLLSAAELKSYFPDEDYGRYGKFRTVSAAELVMIKIGYIGTVTPSSGPVISEARTAYDALSSADKALVANYETLTKAEETFAKMSGKAEVSYSDALLAMLTDMQNGSALGVGSQKGEWAVLSLARGGMITGKDTSGQAVNYLNAVQKALKTGLSSSTDYSRVTLALSSLGVTAPEEVIAQCENYDNAVSQGINAVAFALLALDSKPYDTENTEIREKYINYILENSCNSGGWILGNDKTASADTDVTAMVLQALAPYYKDETRTEVKTAVNNALTALKGMQTENGGFASFETYNAESIAQVIVALTSLGEDPTTWNGKDAVDALLHFYTTKDGKKGFAHILDGDINQMATEQATYALVAYYRFKLGQNTLYDMADAFQTGSSSNDPAKTVAAAAKAIAEMESLSVSMEDVNTEEAALNYVKTTVETKMKLLGITGPTYEYAIKTSTNNEKSFSSATAGTASNENGTEGSFVVEVTVSMSGAVSATKEVSGVIVPTKYVPPKADITVTFQLFGDTKHEVKSDSDRHTYKFNASEMPVWVDTTSVTISGDSTVGDVFKKVMDEKGFTYVGWDTNYISSITHPNGTTLKEKDNTQESGWMYLVNGKHPNTALNSMKLKDGDVIVWHWTDYYPLEEGSEGYNPDLAADYVIGLIDAIGTVTLNSEKAIDAARNAYTSLAPTEKEKVTNYQKLLDAEKALAELKKVNTDVKKVYEETKDYFKALVKKNTPTVNSIGGEWLVLGLARSGAEVPEGYFNNVVSYVKKNIDSKGRLSSSKSTDNSRVILALTAAGYDPRNVGGYNLLEGLTDMDYIVKQGINGPIWALIALDSHNYVIPTSNAANPTTREKLIQAILKAQLSDGGWALSGTEADSDMTGMALQALSPYYNNSNKDIMTAVNKAITKLSSMQQDNGAYATVGTITSESIAQVVTALAALKINPDKDERFVKNGSSAIDALVSYAVKGGGFEHIKGGGLNGMASEQGFYALVAYMRLIESKNSLYDMRDVTLKVGTVTGNGTDEDKKEDEKENALLIASKKDKEAAKKVVDLINTITEVNLNSGSKLRVIRAAYDSLTLSQKKLVTNYDKLVSAENTYVRIKVAYVEKLIREIGTVTLDSKDKIQAARTAYNKLTVLMKNKVTNLSVLEAAEVAYEELLANGKKKATGKLTGGTVTTATTASTYLTEESSAVNELLTQVSDTSMMSELLEVIKAYENLSAEDKALLDKEGVIKELKERVAELAHTDRETGISVSGVDWNVQIVIEDIPEVTEIQSMQEKLGSNTMLVVWNISLKNLLTGEKVEPEGSVLVKIPLELLGDFTAYDGLTVVHYTKDGTAEYLNCTVVGDCIVFNTADFSHYAVAGYYGTSPIEAATAAISGNVEDADNSSAAWIPWTIAGGCSAVLLAVLLILVNKNRKNVQAGE